MSESITLSVIQGDNLRFNIYYKTKAGAPVPIAGYDFVCTVRDQFGGKVICATATVGSGITVDEELSKITVNFTPEQTKNFTYPKAVFQVQYTDTYDVKDTLTYGPIRVEKAAV